MKRYCAPPTDARVAPFFGQGERAVAPFDYYLFSSDSEASTVAELVKAIPGVTNVIEFDGANGPFPNGFVGSSVCPPMIYGSDGRKVNCFLCDYTDPNGGPATQYSRIVGELLAIQGYGLASYNLGSQPPYNKLIVKTLPDDTQIVWGH